MKEYFTESNTEGFTQEDLNALNLTAHLRITDGMNEDQIQNELELIFNEFCDDGVNRFGWSVYSGDVFVGYSPEVLRTAAIKDIACQNNPDIDPEDVPDSVFALYVAEPATLQEKQQHGFASGCIMAQSEEGAE